jgi:hypothetical protein
MYVLGASDNIMYLDHAITFLLLLAHTKGEVAIVVTTVQYRSHRLAVRFHVHITSP